MVSLAMNSYLFDVFILEAIPSLAAGILFGRCATPAGDSRCSTAIRARDWFDGAKAPRARETRKLVELTIDSRRARRFCNWRAHLTTDVDHVEAHVEATSLDVESES